MKTRHNKSLDVRAKQRLCYRVDLFPLTCVQPVSPHVNSVVSRFLISNRGLIEIKNQYATAIS